MPRYKVSFVNGGQLGNPIGEAGGILKGIGRARGATDAASTDLTTLNVSWFYNWWKVWDDMWMSIPNGVEFVPMVYWDYSAHPGDPTPAQCAAVPGVTTILGFNEPDNASEANMTVAAALALWPDFEATGKRLGAPAVSAGHDEASFLAGPWAWIQAFMAGSGGYKPRCGFVPVHWYPDYSPYPLPYTLDLYYDTLGLPIWLTEVSNLGGGVATNAALISTMVDALKTRPWVERVSWFTDRDVAGWPGTGLVTSGTNLDFYNSGFWPAIWSQLYNTTGSAAISASAWGRMTTGTLGAYGDNMSQILNDLVAADTTLQFRFKVTTVSECFPYVFYRDDGANTNGYMIQANPSTGHILFIRKVAGTPTTLTDTTFAMSLNDQVNVEIVTTGNSHSIKYWKEGSGKPGSPTVTLSSSTFATQKRVSLGLTGGNAAASRTCEWQAINLSLDAGGALNAAGSVYAALGPKISRH